MNINVILIVGAIFAISVISLSITNWYLEKRKGDKKKPNIIWWKGKESKEGDEKKGILENIKNGVDWIKNNWIIFIIMLLCLFICISISVWYIYNILKKNKKK